MTTYPHDVMTIKENHLKSLRSALQGVLSTAQAVQLADPGLLAQVYDADDRKALLAMLAKTEEAIGYIKNGTWTPGA